MKATFGLILGLAIAIGCSSRPEERVIIPADVDFDTAIEVIATSNDWNYVNSAQARLAYGGLPAIEELRKHLADTRIIPTGYSTRSINSGKIAVGTQAFWTIQDMIETGLPKMYGNSYAVLRMETVEQWLDERSGKSLVELQIEAARSSLDLASADLASGNVDASDAVDILEDRLSELQSKN